MNAKTAMIPMYYCGFCCFNECVSETMVLINILSISYYLFGLRFLQDEVA